MSPRTTTTWLWVTSASCLSVDDHARLRDPGRAYGKPCAPAKFRRESHGLGPRASPLRRPATGRAPTDERWLLRIDERYARLTPALERARQAWRGGERRRRSIRFASETRAAP